MQKFTLTKLHNINSTNIEIVIYYYNIDSIRVVGSAKYMCKNVTCICSAKIVMHGTERYQTHVTYIQ